MKRKLLICSSLITLLLSVFSVPLFAEEVVQDSSNLHTIADGVLLDQYFYDNYDLLPYLQSNNGQSIDTGVYGSNNIKINLTISDVEVLNYNEYRAIFYSGTGSGNPRLGILYSLLNNNTVFYFNTSNKAYQFIYDPYKLIDISIDENRIYFGNQTYTFNNVDFTTNSTITLFSNHAGQFGSFKLYKFSIFDYSANEGEGGYIRYYYPAKSKSSGTLGLYDAISKTFYSNTTANQFINPTDDYVESFQISSFLSNSLTWIGQIFTAIIDMPIVIVFMAIGLAGVMFRWGRRIVHF